MMAIIAIMMMARVLVLQNSMLMLCGRRAASSFTPPEMPMPMPTPPRPKLALRLQLRLAMLALPVGAALLPRCSWQQLMIQTCRIMMPAL